MKFALEKIHIKINLLCKSIFVCIFMSLRCSLILRILILRKRFIYYLKKCRVLIIKLNGNLKLKLATY